MAIRIISDDEKLVGHFEGATFWYKRLPAHARARIIDEHTGKRSGTTNWAKASIAMLRYALIDWSDVVDRDGNAVPMTAETISYLPDTAQSYLMELLGENASLEDELGNSEASQPSST